MSLRTATTQQAASRALVSADSQEMESTAQVIKHTRKVQPVATRRHSPSPGPASPCVQALQGQAE